VKFFITHVFWFKLMMEIYVEKCKYCQEKYKILLRQW